MCNAYNLRHRSEAILDIARTMQLEVADLPDCPPRHRIAQDGGNLFIFADDAAVQHVDHQKQATHRNGP